MATTNPPRPRSLTDGLGLPALTDVHVPGFIARRPRWLVAGVVLAALMAVSAYLRTVEIGGTLWWAETNAMGIAAQSFGGVLHAAYVDGAAPLYYLLLHFWIAAFGDSVDAMRSMSVLAMAGAAACVTLAGRRLAGTRAGVLAGVAFALVPSVSRFAQEIRSYGLEMLAGTLAVLLLLRALDQPGVRRWAAYGVCVAVLGYFDLVALAVVSGHAAVVAMRWWRDRDHRLLEFVPAALAGLAACGPLAIVSAHQAGGWCRRARTPTSFPATCC